MRQEKAKDRSRVNRGAARLAQLSQLALLRGQFCLVEGSKVESIQWGAFAKRL
jgi:hypothetical protein